MWRGLRILQELCQNLQIEARYLACFQWVG